MGVVLTLMSAPNALELTLAIIKPDAYPKRDEILDLIQEHGFSVVQMRQMTCTREKLGLFYKEHEGKGFYSSLLDFMASGPIAVMVLGKEDAVAQWRAVIGFSQFSLCAQGNFRSTSFFFLIFLRRSYKLTRSERETS
jgi:nucleoside diphosphate kinase